MLLEREFGRWNMIFWGIWIQLPVASIWMEGTAENTESYLPRIDALHTHPATIVSR